MGETNVWGFLSAVAAMVSAIGVVVGPIIANRRAKEVKSDLKIAKQELKDDGAVQAVKLEAVHALVNGDRLAKMRRIEFLEGKLREHGIDSGSA